MSSEYSVSELTLLIERYLSLHQQGISMSVEELCQDSPKLTESVRRELQALDEMDRVLDYGSDEESDEDHPGKRQLGIRRGCETAATRYQLERMIAHGGCSEVYVARDQELNRPVAIKFLRPDTQHLQVYRQRLQREAEITGQLNHPGVVSIHGIGTDSAGLPFYCMRLIEGESLAAAIENFHAAELHRMDTLDGRKLLNHFRDACQTIAFAHNKNVLHRDLKPANIVIGSFGETYVIDWGMARRSDQTDFEPGEDHEPIESATDDTLDSPRLTQLGSVMGSPAYMSPEQATGGEVTIASDVFNLGATLYSILTGMPPYTDASLLKTIRHAEQVSFIPANVRDKSIPQALNAICSKAMNPIAADRYASAEDLATDIERYLADQPVTAMPEPAAERVRRWVKRRKTLVTTVVTSGLIGLILLTVGNAILLDRNRRLADREAEAVFLKGETETALKNANASLYSQRIALAHAEWLKNNPQRALQILNQCPVSLRQWEWHHLHWLVTRHKPLYSAQGAGNSIHAFDFEGQTGEIAFGDNRGRVQFWKPDTDKKTDLETGIEIMAIAYSPDGQRLAVVGNRPDSIQAIVQVWNLATKEQQAVRTSNTGRFISVCWSPDGRRLATGASSGGIRVRDPQTLKPILRIKAHSGGVGCLAFLQTGDGPTQLSTQLFSCGADGRLKGWDDQGENVFDRESHTGGLTSFSFQSEIIATCGNDKLVRLWDVSESKGMQSNDSDAAKILVGHTDSIQTVAVSPNGKYVASAGLDRSIRIWDVGLGEDVAVIRQHSSHIRRVGFDPSGKFLVSSGDDNRINVWKVDAVVRPIPRGRIVGFSHDSGQLLVAGSREITTWSTNDMAAQFRITDQPETLISLATHPSRALVVGTYRRGEVVVWSSSTGKRLHLLLQNNSPAYAAEFSKDGKRLFVGYHDGSLIGYSLESGEVVAETKTSPVIYRMAITCDGTQLVVGHRLGTLQFFRTEDLVPLQTIRAHDGELLDMASNPNRNEISTAGRNGKICIWDPARNAGNKAGKNAGRNAGKNAGKNAGEDGVNDGDNGMLSFQIDVGASWLNCLEYTPDGKRLVSGSEHTITFWDVETGAEVLSLSLDRCVHSMAFSADGKYLAVAGEDPRVRIWEAESFGQVAVE